MSVTETALVPKPEAPPPAPELPRPHNPLDQLRHPTANILTNLDPKAVEYHNMLTRGMATTDEDLGNAAGRVHKIVAFLAHVVNITIEETGEVEERARVVLFTKEGKCFGWSSAITTRYWSLILSVAGAGPWPEGLPIKVVAHKGKDKGHWYSLETAHDPKPVTSKK